jgi:AcrR family transcriptional regulator
LKVGLPTGKSLKGAIAMEHPTRKKIKQEALQLFSANGFDATTMNEIAGRVGVTKPAVYTYFKSKEDLVLSILQEVREDYRRYMETVMDAAGRMPTPEKKLYHLFERYIRYFLEHVWISAFWVRIIFFPPPSLKHKLASHMSATEAHFLEQLKSILRAGMESGDVRTADTDTMALSFYAMREGVLMTFAQKVGTPSIDGIWKNYWLGIQGGKNESTQG